VNIKLFNIRYHLYITTWRF